MNTAQHTIVTYGEQQQQTAKKNYGDGTVGEYLAIMIIMTQKIKIQATFKR